MNKTFSSTHTHSQSSFSSTKTRAQTSPTNLSIAHVHVKNDTDTEEVKSPQKQLWENWGFVVVGVFFPLNEQILVMWLLQIHPSLLLNQTHDSFWIFSRISPLSKYHHSVFTVINLNTHHGVECSVDWLLCGLFAFPCNNSAKRILKGLKTPNRGSNSNITHKWTLKDCHSLGKKIG